ncbi:Pkinase-domain-containing protein [Mycena indigotica]|uniref:Pkinase-domain-containing protein n=1 Tax=Mycena indigotica TaxID=2126181 RepID=A0A8H6VYU8_9AGAR|nr:Pkinase-domain-containing protein [Mycena indigotica]KAF7296866.1 Pkinase-domain-containing protein [Mycena indigotica]
MTNPDVNLEITDSDPDHGDTERGKVTSASSSSPHPERFTEVADADAKPAAEAAPGIDMPLEKDNLEGVIEADSPVDAEPEGEDGAPPDSEDEAEDEEGEPELDSEEEREEAFYWHTQIINELYRACRDASPLNGGYNYLSTLPGVDRMGNIRHTARAERTGEVVLLRVTPLVPPVERFAGQRLINELFLMRDMRSSPNILGFYDLYLSQDDEELDIGEGKSDVWLVQQYMAEGASLGELVAYNNGPGGFTEEQVAKICLETAKGLAHLHEQLIIHRDIRSDSLLIDPTGRVKITNFAYAVQLPTIQSKRRTMVSTLALPARSPYTPDKTHWTPPEVIRRREYGMEVDVWALGITMMEMLDGRPPHSGNAALRVLFLILISGTPKLSREDADALGPDLREFLGRCVEVDVDKRATAEQLVGHDFLQRGCAPIGLASLFEYRTREPPPDSDDEEEVQPQTELTAAGEAVVSELVADVEEGERNDPSVEGAAKT